jgi:hypothetical protein
MSISIRKHTITVQLPNHFVFNIDSSSTCRVILFLTWSQFRHNPRQKFEPLCALLIRGIVSFPHLYFTLIMATQRSDLLLHNCQPAFIIDTLFVFLAECNPNPPYILDSSIHIPNSDITIQNPNSRGFSQFGRCNSARIQIHHDDSDMSTQSMTHQVDDLDPLEESNAPATRLQFTRRISTRLSADSPENSSGGGNQQPQLSRRNSTNVSLEPFHQGRVVTFRDSFDEDDPDDV